MPAESKQQLKAMAAAASGNSTLGIPQSVGQDFLSATPTAKGLPQRAPAKKKPPAGKKGRDYGFKA